MTKAFLLELVHAEAPGLGRKSGHWYWLNDWRCKKQEARACFTYRDLAEHLRVLMQTEGRLPQIPSARLKNHITDFRADLTNAGTHHHPSGCTRRKDGDDSTSELHEKPATDRSIRRVM